MTTRLREIPNCHAILFNKFMNKKPCRIQAFLGIPKQETKTFNFDN